MKNVAILISITCVIASVAVARGQSSAEDERRSAIKLLRAINTAENAARARDGAYLQMADLLSHPMMGGVKGDVAATGSTYTYQGAQVRLALSADAAQYVVTVVHGAPNHTAAFTDERGVIYTGKALE
jgi:hypothetical protein